MKAQHEVLVRDVVPLGLGPEIIMLHQVAVYVIAGGGHLGRWAAENPADFYLDQRTGKLPFSRDDILRAVATLARIATAHGFDPHELPTMPLLHSFEIL
jgi:hypothetical protein